MNVIEISIGLIDVGERRRKDYGDIGALAKGIKRVGLLEPIIVDQKEDRYRLIAGERRLKAVQMLKWKTISAQLRDELTNEELRDIELEENENRKSLTEQERRRTFASSKKLVENAKKAAAILGETPPKKGKRGRPIKSDSTRAVASTLGVDKHDVLQAQQHVDTAEQFP